MTCRNIQTLGLVVGIGLLAMACSADIDAAVDGTVDVDFHATVDVNFHSLDGNVPAETRRGDIVFDLGKASQNADLVPRIRCVGLDPIASSLSVSRLEAEGLESFLDFTVEIAPYPNGEWAYLADFASLVTDQSTRGFDDPGFTIYYDGLEVLEAIAFADTSQFELRVTSRVPNAVLALEVELDLAVALSSEVGACPGPNH